LTPLAAAALIGVMVNAAVAEHGEAGLWSENEGYEYPLVLAVIATVLALGGPGTLAVDDALGWELHGLAWGIGAVAVGVASAVVVLATRRSPEQDSTTGDTDQNPAAESDVHTRSVASS